MAASGRGPVHAVDNAMRKILEKHFPQLAEVKLEEFDVRLLPQRAAANEDDENGAGALVRVLASFPMERIVGEQSVSQSISSRQALSALSTVWNGSSEASRSIETSVMPPSAWTWSISCRRCWLNFLFLQCSRRHCSAVAGSRTDSFSILNMLRPGSKPYRTHIRKRFLYNARWHPITWMVYSASRCPRHSCLVSRQRRKHQ